MDGLVRWAVQGRVGTGTRKTEILPISIAKKKKASCCSHLSVHSTDHMGSWFSTCQLTSQTINMSYISQTTHTSTMIPPLRKDALSWYTIVVWTRDSVYLWLIAAEMSVHGALRSVSGNVPVRYSTANMNRHVHQGHYSKLGRKLSAKHVHDAQLTVSA